MMYRTYCIVQRFWSFLYFSGWNGKSKGHFPDDMVDPIEFWSRSSENLAQNKWGHWKSYRLNHRWDQIKLSGSDSTCGFIDKIFKAPTYFELNFMMTLTKIRLDQPCRQENDLLMFHFNLKNSQKLQKRWAIKYFLYSIQIVS